MLETTDCLNCGNEVSQNFCPNCGQKTTIHRYSILHYIQNDFVSAVTDINRGFLFTLKQLFTRPGESIREYLKGKRVNYITSIAFILLILGLGHILAGYTHIKIADLVPESSKKLMNRFEKFASENPKIVLLYQIPIFSVFSYLWFRKSKFNFTEHLILNTYITAATLIINTIFTIVSIFYTNHTGLQIVLLFTQIFGFLFIVWAYYGFFKIDNYKKVGLILRSILVVLCVQLTPALLGFSYGYFIGKLP